jgi:uncharacterized BrkB/YihY/UPF0761 family membrane protein
MSSDEFIWSVGFLGVLFAAILLFRRVRRKALDYHQSRTARSRLPSRVRLIEKTFLYSFVIVIGLLIGFTFQKLENAGQKIAGATAIYVFFGSMIIAFPIGALLANLLSWLLPPLRKANEAAMSGTQVSFVSVNRGLVKFSIISIPVGLVALIVAGVAPWAK